MSAAPQGIDPRVLGRAMDPTTQERDRPYQPDTSRAAWPPKSRGPLPPFERLPTDLNIFTAHDEIDAWAHDHDRATEALAAVRDLLHGNPEDPHDGGVEEEYATKRAEARRAARSSPTERGRRTAEDISEEVTEALIRDGVWRRREKLLAAVERNRDRMFRAKDNIARLDAYVRSLPRTDHRP